MTVLLIDRAMYEACLDEIVRIEAATGGSIEPVFIPPPDEQLTLEDLERIEIGTPPNGDYEPEGARRFYGGALHAPNIRWVHLPLAGIDDPVFGELLNAGVRLTNASGAMAEPIAWSAIAGLLQLARGFPRWAASQRRHEWETHPRAEFPRDLREQTIVVFGLGAIGMEIARLAQALHLHVIGVRRSPARDGDPVDELVTPAQLAEVLPRADWLAIASPLTDETSGLFADRAADRRATGRRLPRRLRAGTTASRIVALGPASRHHFPARLLDDDSRRLPALRLLLAKPGALVARRTPGTGSVRALAATGPDGLAVLWDCWAVYNAPRR